MSRPLTEEETALVEKSLRASTEPDTMTGREVERAMDPWKHGAESMRHAILQQLPGGQSCDPQQIADMIRAIEAPAAPDIADHKD